MPTAIIDYTAGQSIPIVQRQLRIKKYALARIIHGNFAM